jgi:hypothetical protein
MLLHTILTEPDHGGIGSIANEFVDLIGSTEPMVTGKFHGGERIVIVHPLRDAFERGALRQVGMLGEKFLREVGATDSIACLV